MLFMMQVYVFLLESAPLSIYILLYKCWLIVLRINHDRAGDALLPHSKVVLDSRLEPASQRGCFSWHTGYGDLTSDHVNAVPKLSSSVAGNKHAVFYSCVMPVMSPHRLSLTSAVNEQHLLT